MICIVRDSSTSIRRKRRFPNVYFGPAGVPGLLQAIASLAHNDKDYFSTKIRLINELGFISDSARRKKWWLD